MRQRGIGRCRRSEPFGFSLLANTIVEAALLLLLLLRVWYLTVRAGPFQVAFKLSILLVADVIIALVIITVIRLSPTLMGAACRAAGQIPGKKKCGIANLSSGMILTISLRFETKSVSGYNLAQQTVKGLRRFRKAQNVQTA
ncbi:hypothetical protein EVAR_14608_1 [Eumeta japonica]|uniref:Uncharacterized protein n=1 Tax=Eumeta variegata TaxID=151549 RepID=A0A4C1UUW1_EUMVA|nr:hypothetical protein EVAR_14608_1 [Eumeta japonica]